jgi:hypothetical protein
VATTELVFGPSQSQNIAKQQGHETMTAVYFASSDAWAVFSSLSADLLKGGLGPLLKLANQNAVSKEKAAAATRSAANLVSFRAARHKMAGMFRPVSILGLIGTQQQTRCVRNGETN